MNYKLTSFLLDQRANSGGDMAAINKTGGMSEQDYLTAADSSEGDN
jgi:hypothetical protein